RDVRSGNDPVARTKGRTVARGNLSPALDDNTDVLVAADQRVLQSSLVRRAGVLDRLAPERVLVRPADTRIHDLDQDSPGLRFGPRERLDLDVARPRHDGGAYARHGLRRRRRTSRSYSARASRTLSSSATSATGTSHHVS